MDIKVKSLQQGRKALEINKKTHTQAAVDTLPVGLWRLFTLLQHHISPWRAFQIFTWSKTKASQSARVKKEAGHVCANTARYSGGGGGGVSTKNVIIKQVIRAP